jgi:hypothetical protein
VIEFNMNAKPADRETVTFDYGIPAELFMSKSCTVFKERAVGRERTVKAERAGEHESTERRERADTGESAADDERSRGW